MASALASLLWSGPTFADGAADPATVESSFDAARLADDLVGALTDPTKEIRVGVYASAGSTVSATLTPDADAALVLNPTLTLCDAAGVAVDVTVFDKSVPGSGVITWKRVPLAATGAYTLIVRGTGAGGFRLKLRGTLARIAESATSTSDLGVNAETSVDFHGLRGGTLSFALAPTGRSKFVGELARVERPDGSALTGTPTAAKGKVVLDADGVHRLVFRNVGVGVGAWLAKTNVAPPPLVVRRGYLRAQGAALVPVVQRVTPPADYMRDDAASVTLTGRDFQPGADVRLVRKNFADIVATDVQVVSETLIRCTLNLDTAPVTGVDSLGRWNVGVWNAPVYATPGDPTTLDKTSPTSDLRRSFACVAASAIRLPPGVIRDTETWQLEFNGDFQDDLDAMGLGSADPTTRIVARGAVEAYVVLFLRDLMRQNETTGKLASDSPAFSFVLGRVPGPGGKPGRDYDRIEIGGARQAGDEVDAGEPLPWGAAPVDPGNAHLDDLSIEVDDGAGGTVRVGRGVRTRVLDPTSASANADWANAMQPLRATPLTRADARYFAAGFAPTTAADANRYRDIVLQTTRAAREVAALVAHQIGRATGLTPGGPGPMASPTTAGYLWPTTQGLAFSESDVALLRTNAKPTQVHGKSKALLIGWFPLISTTPSYLPNLTTDVAYSVNWNYVGGRPNASPNDYSVKFTAGNPPIGLTLTWTGLAGKAPLYIDATQGLFYAAISYTRITVTDIVRGDRSDFFYRLNVLANVAALKPPPSPERSNATNANNTILSTP
jgi:hypothetical protein